MSGQRGVYVDDETERIEAQVDLRWVCDDCGAVHRKNNPPCNNCNSMSLSAVEPNANEEEFSEASKFGSRWWYYIAAYPIAGLFLIVATSLLSPFIPDAIAPVTQTLAAITGFIYVFGFPLLGIALFLDARGIRASPLDWSPNPYLYGGTALVLLGASGSNGPEKQSLATRFIGEIATTILPLLAMALCLYYLYRRRQHLGEP